MELNPKRYHSNYNIFYNKINQCRPIVGPPLSILQICKYFNSSNKQTSMYKPWALMPYMIDLAGWSIYGIT